MQRSSKKILIVDDDETMLRLLRRLLGQDYCLAEASSGEEALAMLSSFPADLVMLDIVMPGIDGHETFFQARFRVWIGKIPVDECHLFEHATPAEVRRRILRYLHACFKE